MRDALTDLFPEIRSAENSETNRYITGSGTVNDPSASDTSILYFLQKGTTDNSYGRIDERTAPDVPVR